MVLRGAGRKKLEVVSEEGHPVKCAEVLMMLETMSDYEIMEKLNMKKATYYRHKKPCSNPSGTGSMVVILN